jgi:hypothetical protein
MQRIAIQTEGEPASKSDSFPQWHVCSSRLDCRNDQPAILALLCARLIGWRVFGVEAALGTGTRRHLAPSLSFKADNLARCCALVALMVVKPREMLNCHVEIPSPMGFDKRNLWLEMAVGSSR